MKIGLYIFKKKLDSQCIGLLDLWLLECFLTHTFPVFLPNLPFFIFYASPTGLMGVPKVRGEDVSTGPGRLSLGMPVNGEHGQEGGRTLQKLLYLGGWYRRIFGCLARSYFKNTCKCQPHGSSSFSNRLCECQVSSSVSPCFHYTN